MFFRPRRDTIHGWSWCKAAVSKLESAAAEKIIPGRNSTLCSNGKDVNEPTYSSQESLWPVSHAWKARAWLAGTADPRNGWLTQPLGAVAGVIQAFPSRT